MNRGYKRERLDYKFNKANNDSKKMKRSSVEKFHFKDNNYKLNNKNDKNNSDNFWDIDLNNEKKLDYNITYYNNFNNNNINENNEQKNNNIFYEKYKKALKTIGKDRKNNYTLGKNIISLSKNINKNENRTDYRNRSIDNNKMNKKYNQIKFEELSFLKRNQKWIEKKNERVNKAIEKLNDKKERELIENTTEYKINKKDINTVFNEEENVTVRPENFKFFMRLIQGRQEKERALSYYINAYSKVNCLKNSHYSGRRNGSISQKEMNKYVKFMRNELKGSTN